MLTTNDSTAFERPKFNKDLVAFRKRISTDFGRDFVPAKFAVLAADQIAYPFTDGFSWDVVHRGSLADFSRSMVRIPSGRCWNVGNWQLLAISAAPPASTATAGQTGLPDYGDDESRHRRFSHARSGRIAGMSVRELQTHSSTKRSSMRVLAKLATIRSREVGIDIWCGSWYVTDLDIVPMN
jgi:hypothetical protein